MPIPLHQRILVRESLINVYQMSDVMQQLISQIQLNKGKTGVLQVSVTEYLKLVAEARRVEYIVVGLGLSEKGITLQMPDEKSAESFRANMDIAINSQLRELDNKNPKLILVDNSDNNNKVM